jgi:hypothetical protein
MNEQRAKRILELERYEKMSEWDKNNPAPKEITYQQKVALAVTDKDWLKQCVEDAANSGRYKSFNVELSRAVQKAQKPSEDHQDRREKYEESLRELDRIELIKMLKGK